MGRNKTHGLAATPEYKVWVGMKRRCENPKAANYPRYGGRGIRVCQRWLDSFEAFLDDMGKRPDGNHQIGRIDTTKGYEPGNCRWVTVGEQAKNRRNTLVVEAYGRTMPVSDWAREYGVKSTQIISRLRRGYSVEYALSKPEPRSKSALRSKKQKGRVWLYCYT